MADNLQPFWQRKRLSEMNVGEWESLCDGCAKCCLQKLHDEDDPEETVYYTELACDLLDMGTCRCSDYTNRHARVPSCVWLTLDDLDEFHWLPATCAYRRLAEGRDLPDWHPLVTGRADSTREAGYAVTGRARHVASLDEADWPEHIAEWPLEESP
ncbi:MAG: YcgN family cysteine cluster protein [Halothiobacillus sp.]